MGNSNGSGIMYHRYFSSSSRNNDGRLFAMIGMGILRKPTISIIQPFHQARREISTKRRRKFKVKKMHYRKAIKKARYLSTIPQYEGVIGRIKKRPLIKEHVGTPRLRLLNENDEDGT